jgi:hypothetical protein
MAVPQLRWLVTGFPTWQTGFQHGSGHVGFVVDKVALEHGFSGYFGYLRQSFQRLLHVHHPLSSGDGARGQIVTDVPRELSLSPPQETKTKMTAWGGGKKWFSYSEPREGPWILLLRGHADPKGRSRTGGEGQRPASAGKEPSFPYIIWSPCSVGFTEATKVRYRLT